MDFSDYNPEDSVVEPSVDDLRRKLLVINVALAKLKGRPESEVEIGNLVVAPVIQPKRYYKDLASVANTAVFTTCCKCGIEVVESDIRRHTSQDCETLFIVCPNSECKAKMQKSQLKFHLKYECIRVHTRDMYFKDFKTRQLTAQFNTLQDAVVLTREEVIIPETPIPSTVNDVAELEQTIVAVTPSEFTCINSSFGCSAKFTSLSDLSKHLNATTSITDGICVVEIMKCHMAEKGYTKRNTRVTCRACGIMITLMGLRRHEQNFCKNRYVPCKNWEFGCTRMLRCQDRVLHEDVSKILSANVGGTVNLVSRKGTALICNMRTCLMFTNSGMLDYHLKYGFPSIDKKIEIQSYYMPSARIDISEGMQIPCEGHAEEEKSTLVAGSVSPPWTVEFWLHRGTYIQAAQLGIMRCLRIKYGLFDEHTRRENLAFDYVKTLRSSMEFIADDLATIVRTWEVLGDQNNSFFSDSLDNMSRILCALRKYEYTDDVSVRLKLLFNECPSMQDYAATISFGLVSALELFEHQSWLTTLCGFILWNDLQLTKSDIDNAVSYNESFPDSVLQVDEVVRGTEWWLDMSWDDRADLVCNDMLKHFPETMMVLHKRRSDMGIIGGDLAQLMGFKGFHVEETSINVQPSQIIDQKPIEEDESDAKQKKRKQKSAERRKRKKTERSETRNEKQSLKELLEMSCRGVYLTGGDILTGCVSRQNNSQSSAFCCSTGLNIPESVLSEVMFACPAKEDTDNSENNFSYMSLQCGPEGKVGMKFNCGGWTSKVERTAEESSDEAEEHGNEPSIKNNFNHPCYVLFDFACPRESWIHLGVSCTPLVSNDATDFRFSLYIDGRIVSSVKYSDFSCTSTVRPIPFLPVQFVGCPPVMNFRPPTSPDPLGPTLEDFDHTFRRRIASASMASRGLSGGTMMQEVRIWKLARKPKEIKEFYSEKLPMVPDSVQKDGLYLWWSLEDDFGSSQNLIVDNAELRCRSSLVDSLVDNKVEENNNMRALSNFEREANRQRIVEMQQKLSEGKNDAENDEEAENRNYEIIQSHGHEWVYGEAEVGCPSPTMSFRMMNACLVELKRAKMAQKGRKLLQVNHTCPLGCGQIMRKLDERCHVRYMCSRRLVKCRRYGCKGEFMASREEDHVEHGCLFMSERAVLAAGSMHRQQQTTCCDCNAHVLVGGLKDHMLDDCPCRLVNCKYYPSCAERIPFNELSFHVNHACSSKELIKIREMVERSRARAGKSSLLVVQVTTSGIEQLEEKCDLASDSTELLETEIDDDDCGDT